MRLSVLLSGLAAAGSIASAERSCGSHPPRGYDREFTEAVAALGDKANVTNLAGLTIDTYFHVITSGSTGSISDSTLQAQINAMNQHYGPAGVQFRLIKATRSNNSQWASGNDEAGMKRALHQGTYSSLNVYFIPNLSDGLLGICNFPRSNPTQSTVIMDGCMVRSGTVPGGSTTNYNQGKTTTHEVGHYLGLYHVFSENGSCQDSDMVADTPAQSKKTSGCPSSQDSCPGGGVDSIHNYMDYSYDYCMNQFTRGQANRIAQVWNAFRAPY
uniref:Metalloprotease 1 n=1 Tax=Onygena corvina TaxID=180788 RepID=A0A0B4VLA5_9EURO|nr:metalloprotease 1 [Onygena corvina]